MADTDEYEGILGVRAATLAQEHAKERLKLIGTHAQEQAALAARHPLATYTPPTALVPFQPPDTGGEGGPSSAQSGGDPNAPPGAADSSGPSPGGVGTAAGGGASAGPSPGADSGPGDGDY